jgi:hypothetical protein
MHMEIDVEGEGLGEAMLIKIGEGSTRAVILDEVSARNGIAREELHLFAEDGDEVLELDAIVTEADAGVVHHAHRALKIKVTVNYNGSQAEKDFAPSARIQRVLDWAVKVKEFKIDPAIAPEMELALHGQTMELPKQAHVGRYVKHPHHKVDLDLIRGVIPNGAKP